MTQQSLFIHHHQNLFLKIFFIHIDLLHIVASYSHALQQRRIQGREVFTGSRKKFRRTLVKSTENRSGENGVLDECVHVTLVMPTLIPALEKGHQRDLWTLLFISRFHPRIRSFFCPQLKKRSKNALRADRSDIFTHHDFLYRWWIEESTEVHLRSQ